VLQVAQNAVVALGLVGAGTNNARLATILRNLSSYYYKEPTLLFLVRVAQGLVHMGKGLVGLSPYHTERQLLSGKRGRGGALLRHYRVGWIHTVEFSWDVHEARLGLRSCTWFIYKNLWMGPAAKSARGLTLGILVLRLLHHVVSRSMHIIWQSLIGSSTSKWYQVL
jgi:hypothetical protein